MILIFSVNTNHESVAYRSFSPSKFEARGARKVTTGMGGVCCPHVGAGSWRVIRGPEASSCGLAAVWQGSPPCRRPLPPRSRGSLRAPAPCLHGFLLPRLCLARAACCRPPPPRSPWAAVAPAPWRVGPHPSSRPRLGMCRPSLVPPPRNCTRGGVGDTPGCSGNSRLSPAVPSSLDRT